MPNFILRRHGHILGTYSGADEYEALDSFARVAEGDYGFKIPADTFREACTKNGAKRDEFSVEEIKGD